MICLRGARSTDAGALGAILSEFVDTTEWMPKRHSRAEDIAHAGKLTARGGVHVALRDGVVQGFTACDRTNLDALYVANRARGRESGRHC